METAAILRQGLSFRADWIDPGPLVPQLDTFSDWDV
jgi:hypothetical protein